MKSKILAISAISASFVAIILTFGAYVEAVDLISLVIASAFVILPLYYNSYKGSFLSFLSGGVIAFMLSGFNVFSLVFPSYICFFGIYPIIRFVLDKKNISKTYKALIGIIWSVLYFIGVYFYYTLVMGLEFVELPQNLIWLNDYMLYIVGGLGVLFYFIFDRYVTLIRIIEERILSKIIK